MPYFSKRKFFKEPATKYIISTSTPKVETDIRNRIMYGVPLSSGEKFTVFLTVNKNFMKCKFIVEEACMVTGMVQHHIRSMGFCVI